MGNPRWSPIDFDLLCFHNISRRLPVRHCTNYLPKRGLAATATNQYIEKYAFLLTFGRKKTLSRDY
jgi:hypothetical protein